MMLNIPGGSQVDAAEDRMTVIAGERRVDCFSEQEVVVTKVYHSEIHVDWSGTPAVFPRAYFEDVFYPATTRDTYGIGPALQRIHARAQGR